MDILVGYTGFVGSNIYAKGHFDKVYNSKNIEEAFGTNPDILIYAGVRAEKFLANNDEAADYACICEAFENIKKINPKKVVLISTIDIYQRPIGVNELSIIETEGLHPYGLNRYKLEKMVSEHFDDHLIIRLPGLFGNNIKKNFIYDLINIIPNMLTNDKYQELSNDNKEIKDSYANLGNGFYKCKVLTTEARNSLKKAFLHKGFSALSFTDSRGKFQFYNLDNLYEHIQIALKNNVKVLNLATEPVLINDIYKKVFNKEFTNELDKDVPNYDFKTIHGKIFNGENNYIFNKEKIIADIEVFVKKEMEKGE